MLSEVIKSNAPPGPLFALPTRWECSRRGWVKRANSHREIHAASHLKWIY
jgi:hypothetical protein